MAGIHHLRAAVLGDVWQPCIIPGLPGEISQRLLSFVRGGEKEFKSFFKWEKLVIYGSWKERREGGEGGEVFLTLRST